MFDPMQPRMGGLETEEDRQQFLLFAIAVAGKEAQRTKAALNLFLIELLKVVPDAARPFDMIHRATDEQLMTALKASKIGQYSRIFIAYREVAERFSYPRYYLFIPLYGVKVEELESVHGIGPKTARYFVQYAQGNRQVAAIDTHLLKWLRDLGYGWVPKNTPPAGPRYRACEEAFLHECYIRSWDPIEADFKVWKAYREGSAVA